MAANAPRPQPPVQAPKTAPPATAHRAAVKKAVAMPRRRKNPLATLMVLAVLTVVIAAGTGMAFAGIR